MTVDKVLLGFNSRGIFRRASAATDFRKTRTPVLLPGQRRAIVAEMRAGKAM